ncbi:sugar ABC transporter permease [Paenibacillus sp. FSL R7-0048]|jgi:multiple sugar transport system permease protein|uniref:ABC transporter permease n=2 Tax=Paenibacillus TaxID=44249 RepID=A0AAD0KDI0_9BACL|nr:MULTISPECIES: sugar ABC transporter permease [Paenibacillus]AWV31659.1 ABC transporter permease [Paenibacillus odorifer]MDH6429195.1 multiple sugar transport system permease protein [Paenibacillus sp. PastH-4]MDH6445402.1 multiple sugar transport system permease protein [Paenibacillus sp. PastF-4]MDH6529290.1 multiple sugar transport system permease protein [Paenibacillus sp. PastH-3]
MNPESKTETAAVYVKKHARGVTKEAVAGYLFAAPAIIGFLVLTLYPMLASLFYSFHKITIMSGSQVMEWIGLDNFRYIFTNTSSEFKKSITVTLIYAFINVALVITFCLIVALLLNRKFIGRNLMRAIFFLPSVVPMLATTIVWQMLLQNQAKGGLLNWILLQIGIAPVDFLTDPIRIFETLFIMSLWTCGGTIVVFIATLQDVPGELLEAIEMDGGNAWHKFLKVTYPTIKPVLFFQLIMCMMTSIQIYTQSVVLSRNGAPDRMTYFINVMIYDHSFVQVGMRGLASAEAWVVFLITMAITGVLFYFQGAFKRDDSMGKRKKAR